MWKPSGEESLHEKKERIIREVEEKERRREGEERRRREREKRADEDRVRMNRKTEYVVQLNKKTGDFWIESLFHYLLFCFRLGKETIDARGLIWGRML